MDSFMEKYGAAILIAVAILLVLAFTAIGAMAGRFAMLGTAALLIWLAIRLLQFREWRDKKYWEFNAGIGASAVVLFAIMAFVMYFDPPMPNLGSGDCRVSRYESC